VDEPSSPQRPEIAQTVSQGARGDYVRAARALGRTDVDVVLLQHEFGIFGGRNGEYVLSFARELSPSVVDLDTGPAAGHPSPCRLAAGRQSRNRGLWPDAARRQSPLSPLQERRGESHARPASAVIAARGRWETAVGERIPIRRNPHPGRSSRGFEALEDVAVS
jgi:hypothetical protein